MEYGEEQCNYKLGTPLETDAQNVVIDKAIEGLKTLNLDHELETEAGGLIATVLKKLMSGVLLVGA